MSAKLEYESLKNFIIFVTISTFLLMIFHYYFENKFKD